MNNKSSVAFQCYINKLLRRFGNLRYTLTTAMFIYLLLLLLLLTSCKDSTSTSYNETRINEIMYNIETAFNDHDIYTLMLYIHPDYLHDGQNKWQIREVWLTRMAEYLLIDFQNIDIQVFNGFATVSFKMKLTNANETVYTDEPPRHGDLSYFIFDNSDWIVYGNQHQ